MSIDVAKKVNFLRHTSQMVVESIFLDGLNVAHFEKAQKVTESMISLLCEDDDILNMLQMLDKQSHFLYSHSVGVSIYSTLLARELGWTSQVNLFKVTTAGLFHDIGLKELDPALLKKSRYQMKLEEVKIYETHPARGKEILNSIASIPPDIALIAYQHHEKYSNDGYPRRLKKQNIHPMAGLIAVADTFCDLALKGPNSAGITASQALINLMEFHGQELEPRYVTALLKLFKFPIPKPYIKYVNQYKAS
ncbi:MAG: HD-GYP domain-containing protein [Bdellovibrionales bacterium]